MNKALSLFHVQDGDRPMWVIAENYGQAAERWREQIAKENPDDDCGDDQPDGVSLIASGTDLDDMPDILLPPVEGKNFKELIGQSVINQSNKTEQDRKDWMLRHHRRRL